MPELDPKEKDLVRRLLSANASDYWLMEIPFVVPGLFFAAGGAYFGNSVFVFIGIGLIIMGRFIQIRGQVQYVEVWKGLLRKLGVQEEITVRDVEQDTSTPDGVD